MRVPSSRLERIGRDAVAVRGGAGFVALGLRLGLMLSAAVIASGAGLPVARAEARDSRSARAEARDSRSARASATAYARAIEAAVEAYNRDDFVTARHYFALAHEQRPSARTWRGLGMAAFELKFFEDAVRELTFALEDRRSALLGEMRAETELTLRVAQRRLAERREPLRSGAPTATPAPAPLTFAASSSGLGGQRIAALVLAGSALVSVGVGVAFGLRSIAKGRERDRSCPEVHAGCPSPSAVQAADAALTAGDVSTAAWLIGAAALSGGVVLWLTGGPAAPERPQRSGLTQLAIGPAGLAVGGAF